MIFVFGSNKSGIHGAGAAKYAYKNLGAIWGVGEGMTGKCYALPTKGKNITFISIFEVKKAINRFIKTAYYKKTTQFQVTQIGCGLGGFTAKQIAPYFQDAPDNCYFDEKWYKFLKDEKKYWGTF